MHGTPAPSQLEQLGCLKSHCSTNCQQSDCRPRANSMATFCFLRRHLRIILAPNHLPYERYWVTYLRQAVAPFPFASLSAGGNDDCICDILDENRGQQMIWRIAAGMALTGFHGRLRRQYEFECSIGESRLTPGWLR